MPSDVVYLQIVWLLLLLFNSPVSGQCSFHGNCMFPGRGAKRCMCTCLEVKAINQRSLHLYTNYRCTELLKACKEILTVSFSYTVVDDTSQEEIYTSEKISVPYKKEIQTEIGGLSTAGTYTVKIKPYCTICGEDCLLLPYINIAVPKETEERNLEEAEKAISTTHIHANVYIVIVTSICLITVGFVILNILLIRRKRQHEDYHQTLAYG